MGDYANGLGTKAKEEVDGDWSLEEKAGVGSYVSNMSGDVSR